MHIPWLRVVSVNIQQTHGVSYDFLHNFMRAFTFPLPQQVLITCALIQSSDASSQDEGAMSLCVYVCVLVCVLVSPVVSPVVPMGVGYLR